MWVIREGQKLAPNLDEKTPMTRRGQAFCMLEQGAKGWQREIFTRENGINHTLAEDYPAACFDIWLATFHIIEMLYDTPFPETAQTDHTPEKADRNTEIIALYDAGETGASIAQAFGISEQRVNQIIRGQRS